MPGRVLMASWLFPPHSSIGAKRAWRFARHLPSLGWRPTVLSRRVPPPGSFDASDWTLPPEVTLSPTYDAAWMSLLADRGARAVDRSATQPIAAEALRRPLAARLQERWDRFVDAVVPMETAIIHAPHAARELDRLLPSHDLLWTTSYPYHTHAIGLAAARRHRRPWVADLRDPWTPNWVHRRKSAPVRAIEARYERAVYEAADAIVVTTETLAALDRERFPQWAGKIHCVHNSFDGEAIEPAARTTPEGPARWVHFGNVYGPWSLETVFRAMARRPGRVLLDNHGKLSDRDRDLAASLGLTASVRVLPTLPFAEGMARLQAADALVLAAWNHPDAGLFLQGKLYDYLRAGRPIVAESAQREVCDIVRRTGAGHVIAPGDADAMTAVIDGAAVVPTRDAAAVRYFSAAEASGRLAAIFDDLMRRR
ncbi:MAG: glycosyltransferase [Deltaproteobacteria bacterium]|nr:glycosyltransferase [Myxococcales bacterium]MDP3215215.1 glycosyltransferase [Deltaproteobacteria bacterium]